MKISDVKRELKKLHSLSQTDVMSNLTYLINRGWVNTVDQEKIVSTKGGTTVPSVVTFYEVSADGIDRIEGESEFGPRDRYPGINIEASGSNVITLGDGNVVNVAYRQLFHQLSELKEAITRSDKLSEAEKLEVAIDIETLKNQLAKSEPDPEVAGRLWPRIAKAADIAELAGVVVEAASAAQGLFG